ncbi:MAG: helix-turn-helix transcriptional regulator [Elusimicrobia bacterium]|nr:helix-turn-helix transcriptional regulator [Elusimicrobiota bacterium]
MNRREKRGGFDHYVNKTFRKDPQLKFAYLTELSTEPITTQIAVLRHRLGLTQEEVAKRMHLKQSNVARLENKGENPTAKMIDRAARALGCRVLLVPEKELTHFISNRI